MKNKDRIKEKIADLKKFVTKNNLKITNLEVSGNTVAHFEDDYFINCRSSYYDKRKMSKLVFEMIKKYLVEINLATEFEIRSLRFEKKKLNSLMTKIDRTIKNNDLVVGFKNDRTFGGYTQSRKNIVLFDPQEETISEYMKIVPGINYHELSHVLFTCSFRTLAKDLTVTMAQYDPDVANLKKRDKKILINSLLRIVNAFEDGRAESLMGNRYGAALPYFEKTVYNFLLSSLKERAEIGDKFTEMDCVLIASRKYLPTEVRKWVFDKYLERDDVDEAKAIRLNSYINKYVTLSWRTNRQEMVDLIIGFFFEFLKEDYDKNDDSQWQEMLDKMIKSMETAMNNMSESESDDIDESEENILKKVLKDMIGENFKPSKKKGKGEKVKTASESRPSGGNDDDSEQKGTDEVLTLVKQKLTKANNQINKEGSSIEAKLRKTKVDHGSNVKYKDGDVSPEMKRDELSLEKKLKEFMRMCRNGYAVRKRKGAVDIGEARRQDFRGGMRIFRQYKHNIRKALDIDVAFVLDCSYSMGGGFSRFHKMSEASKQLWIASTACKSVGAKLKIFTFSNIDLGCIEQPSNKYQYRIPSVISGTIICPTLAYAENYLNCSAAHTKWLIVLTDGEIQDHQEHEQYLDRMKHDNITCGKINLTGNEYDNDYMNEANHSYDYVLNMTALNGGSVMDGENIITFFKKIYDVSLSRAQQ